MQKIEVLPISSDFGKCKMAYKHLSLKGELQTNYIEQGCEDNRVNFKCMKKSTAIEWCEMTSVGRIKVKVAKKKV